MTHGLASYSGAAIRLWFIVLEKLAERLIHFVLEELAIPGNPAEQVIQAGNDQNSQHGPHEHPADPRRANGAVSNCPGARGNDQWQETGDERERRHLNRPEAQFPSFDASLMEGEALPAP